MGKTSSCSHCPGTFPIILNLTFHGFLGLTFLQLDYDKLAELAGFSNGRSANASWLVIKKKLMGGPNASDTTTTNGICYPRLHEVCSLTLMR